MKSMEKRMLLSFWEKTGGLLVDPFLIAVTDNLEKIEADGVIIQSENKKVSRDQEMAAKDVIAVFCVEGSPSLSTIGKGFLSRIILKEVYDVRSVAVVIVCTRSDQLLSDMFSNTEELKLHIIDSETLLDDANTFPVELGGLKFNFICNIEPVREYSSGQVKEYFPDLEFEGDLSLHKFGSGPFCAFTIPISMTGQQGMYLILVNDQLKYVGICDDLYEKFHFQLGHIQPRDCYRGGHPERCRVNHLILEAVQAGKNIKLGFAKSEKNENQLLGMIRDLKPQWNIRGKRAPRQKFPRETALYGKLENSSKINSGAGLGKRYKSLTEYLQNIQNDEIIMTFEEIEKIIERKLPPSAYKYIAWWSNGDRTQAIAWLTAGWRVKSVELGKSVVFWRVNK